jgi:hypothetical protein
MVTYSIGMDSDPDRDLELDEDAGCSGRAWQSGEVAVADLDAASANPILWKMTQDQHNKVPTRLKSIISVPIPGHFQLDGMPERPIGTLSVDCEAILANTGWCTNAQGGVDPTIPPEVVPNILTIMSAWAAIIGSLLP